VITDEERAALMVGGVDAIRQAISERKMKLHDVLMKLVDVKLLGDGFSLERRKAQADIRVEIQDLIEMEGRILDASGGRR
jgi:hypothetical protein